MARTPSHQPMSPGSASGDADSPTTAVTDHPAGLPIRPQRKRFYVAVFLFAGWLLFLSYLACLTYRV